MYTISVYDGLLFTDGSLYMATPVDPVFILLPIFDEARMKVTLCFLIHYYFLSDFPRLGNVKCDINLLICRKVTILESSGNLMRFYLLKDFMDINSYCHLQRTVWNSFVKLKVYCCSMVSENMVDTLKYLTVP